jgi:hypothetical protein
MSTRRRGSAQMAGAGVTVSVQETGRGSDGD